MSQVRIAIRPSAVSDLDEIQAYFIARDVTVADRFAVAAAADFERLAEMPGLGRRADGKEPAFAWSAILAGHGISELSHLRSGEVRSD